MRKSVFLIFALVAFSFPSISSLSMDCLLDDSGSARLFVKSVFSGSEGRSVFLNLSAPPAQVSVKDRSGLLLNYTIKKEGNNTLIAATVPADYLEFDILSESFTAKEGSAWNFDLALGASENISAFNASLALPDGAVLKSTNGAVRSGRDSLVISWAAHGVDTSHRVRLKAGYELLPQPSEDSGMLLALAALGVLAALSLALYLRQQPFRKEPPPAAQETPSGPEPQPSPLSSNPVFRTLDETDKEIVMEISAQKGKTTQSHLYLNTHIPKATLSRRLASLENKGLIVRSQKGNRKLVTLAELLK